MRVHDFDLPACVIEIPIVGGDSVATAYASVYKLDAGEALA